jgi:hypothetical protein
MKTNLVFLEKIQHLKYPFQPLKRSHTLLAFGLFVWIFVFLYLTEPLGVSVLNTQEKLTYLPLYGAAGALSYLGMLPFQYWLLKRRKGNWFLLDEFIFLLVFAVVGFILARVVYRYIIVYGEPNPYSLGYYLIRLYAPAISIVLPILLIGRWGMGRYHKKRLEDTKVEIKGEGNYEGLRLSLNDIICIKSDDNYITVSFVSGTIVKKQVIRGKLSQVENDIDSLLRTHRSFLINPHHFLQWKMEQGKASIELNHTIFVPVSKTYTTALKAQLNFTTN